MVIKNRKIIVTGGAGFIGSNLVRELVQNNRILVVDNFSVGKKENLSDCLGHKNLKIMRADILDREKVAAIFKGYDMVIHLAAQCVRKSIRNPWLVHEVNTTGTLNILEASRMNKIKKFLYVSSSEVYGTAKIIPMKESHPLSPTTIYGSSKLSGEFYSLAYLRTYDFPVIIVRPFNAYGYNSHFEGVYGEVIPRFVVRALNSLPLQIFGSGKQTRDFTFVTDTANGILSATEKGKIGEIYNIARGEEVSVLELAKLIMNILEVKVPLEHLPSRPGDVQRHFANTEKAKKELGFYARIKIEDGLKKYINWFKQNIPNPKAALKFYEEKNW